MLLLSPLSCIQYELTRWYAFYWEYPYKRFLMEPIAVIAVWFFMLRHNRKGALLLLLIALCGFSSLAAAAASQMAVVHRLLRPSSSCPLQLPIHKSTAKEPSESIPTVISAIAILLGLANHLAWFGAARALTDSAHYLEYREAMQPSDKMFVRGVDTHAFIAEDSRLLSHWFFEFYEAQARSIAGERNSILYYLREQGISLILVNHHLRDFLVVQNNKSENQRKYSELGKLLSCLDPYAPTDPNHPEIYIVRVKWMESGDPEIDLVTSFPRRTSPDWWQLFTQLD